MSFLSDLKGTLNSFFKIGSVRLKNNSDRLELRNSGDSAYCDLTLDAIADSSGTELIKIITGGARVEKLLLYKVINLGAGTAIDVSLGHVFKKSISTNTTLTITGTSALVSGYEYDFRLNLSWTAGTLSLPSGTYINGTTAPNAIGNYSLIFITDDAGATWRIGGV